jgi:hypothetical protein
LFLQQKAAWPETDTKIRHQKLDFAFRKIKKSNGNKILKSGKKNSGLLLSESVLLDDNLLPVFVLKNLKIMG